MARRARHALLRVRPAMRARRLRRAARGARHAPRRVAEGELACGPVPALRARVRRRHRAREPGRARHRRRARQAREVPEQPRDGRCADARGHRVALPFHPRRAGHGAPLHRARVRQGDRGRDAAHQRGRAARRARAEIAARPFRHDARGGARHGEPAHAGGPPRGGAARVRRLGQFFAPARRRAATRIRPISRGRSRSSPSRSRRSCARPSRI